jgi:hypothetical protein
MMQWATDYAKAFFPTIERPDLCTIFEPPASTGDDYGQASSSPFTTLVSDEPCLLYPTQATGREGVGAGQVQEEGSYRIELRYTLPQVLGGALFRVESFDNPLTITGAAQTTPIVITLANHGLKSGSRVSIRDVLGNTAANGKWVIVVINANSFSLTGSIGNAPYTSGGIVRLLEDYELASKRDSSYSSAAVFDLRRAK